MDNNCAFPGAGDGCNLVGYVFRTYEKGEGSCLRRRVDRTSRDPFVHVTANI